MNIFNSLTCRSHFIIPITCILAIGSNFISHNTYAQETLRIGNWNEATFSYAIYSESKKIKIKMSRPGRKRLITVIPYISWEASFLPFTRPDIKGDNITNVQMREFKWDRIRKSAEGGNEHSAYLLAHKLISSKRYGEAAYFLKLSSLKGHGASMNDLGVLSLFGMGVPRNISSAYDMFNKSASNGIPMGNFNVGLCYMMGLGCRQNFQSAKSHIQRAANQKLPMAEVVLAINHAIGTPIASKDPQKAYKLVLLARAHGFGWGLDARNSNYFVDLSKLERYIEQLLGNNPTQIQRIQKSIPSSAGLNSPYRKSHIEIIKSYEPKPGLVILGPDTNIVINSFEDIPYMGDNTGMAPVQAQPKTP